MQAMNELYLELKDTEWPFTYTDHDREIVRAIVFDDEGWFYFTRITRDDHFGKATLIETSGGGVEKGEDLLAAIHRELREELGAEVEVLCPIGTVSDYATSFGEKHLMPDEIHDFHLSTLRLTFDEAQAEYERLSCTPIGRLIAARELPILRRARELLEPRP